MTIITSTAVLAAALLHAASGDAAAARGTAGPPPAAAPGQAAAAVSGPGATAAVAAAPAGTPDWLVEGPSGVVRLRLAHADAAGSDEGLLTVDPDRRLVSWKGVPEAHGCRLELEVPFSAVRAVREAEGLVRLELKGEPRDRWLFLPLPHASWLTGVAARARPAGSLAAPAAVPEGAMTAETSADVRLAVERLQRALGRPALPSVAVYEALYGSPVDVALATLVENPGALQNRAVRVRGAVEPGPRGEGLVLVAGDARIRLAPEPEIALLVSAASRAWRGREVQVTGVIGRVSGTADPQVVFWEYDAPDETAAAHDEARTVSIREIVESPEALAGRTVRVVGRFRGRNLFHDLEGEGPRGAWVLKSRRDAIWVTGHDASGVGFRLDPQMQRDTTRWVEVVGVVQPRNGGVWLRARSVSLAAAATFVWSGPRTPSNPRPEVVFTIPLSGEAAPLSGSPLLVQFSSYMDEESFEGRVRVLWGPGWVADREARRARWTYDDSHRVLVVDPGQPLRPGGTVEVQLLPGIADVNAAALAVAPGAGPDDPALVLRWTVAGVTASASAR